MGVKLAGDVVPQEMADHVRTFVEHCRSRHRPGVIHWVEKPFNLGALNPPGPMFGTADHVAYDPDTRSLFVDDLKYGQGVVVEAIGNEQLRYYGLGAALTLGPEYPIDDVYLTIVQPRASHPDGIIRTEQISFLELIGFASELMAAARKTLEPNAPLIPGPHCRFCPASGICPAQRKQALEIAQADFDVEPAEFTPPAPSLIPKEQFVFMLSQLHILEDWASAMRSRAQGMLERGEEVPGFKMVEKRANRKWVDEEAAAEALRAVLPDTDHWKILEAPALKSPAQIEKLLKKKNFAELMSQFVEKKSSGYTMVADSDSRPAVALSPADDFLALPSGEE